MSPIRILLVEDVELEARLAIRALADRGFADIVHVVDAESATAALDDRPCVVVTDIELPKKSGLDLIRAVRARATGYVYVLVLTGRGSPDRLRHAFEAGADDYMTKPFQRDELVARVQVGERIVRLERYAHLRSMELEAALRRLDAHAATEALARANARERAEPKTAADALLETAPWADLRAALAEGLGAFLGTPATVVQTSDPPAAVVGQVTLIEPSRGLELGLALVVGAAATGALHQLVFGEPGDVESGCALVLETGNILMGAVKTLLSTRGYEFTSGVPTSASLAEARATHDNRALRQRFAFRAGNVSLDVWIFAAEKKNSKMRAEDLREGMVLAEDARDRQGMLLVKAGVRLTETSARRLGTMLGRGEVVVAA